MVVLYDQFNLPDSVYEIIFATKQQVLVAKLLIEEMKLKDGEIGKTEMSMFATALHEGKLVEETEEGPGPMRPKKKITLSYNKRQFYDRPDDLLPFVKPAVVDIEDRMIAQHARNQQIPRAMF